MLTEEEKKNQKKDIFSIDFQLFLVFDLFIKLNSSVSNYERFFRIFVLMLKLANRLYFELVLRFEIE